MSLKNWDWVIRMEWQWILRLLRISLMQRIFRSRTCSSYLIIEEEPGLECWTVAKSGVEVYRNMLVLEVVAYMADIDELASRCWDILGNLET